MTVSVSETEKDAKKEFCEEICEEEIEKGEHLKKCVGIGKVKKRHWKGKNFKWVDDLRKCVGIRALTADEG